MCRNSVLILKNEIVILYIFNGGYNLFPMKVFAIQKKLLPLWGKNFIDGKTSIFD